MYRLFWAGRWISLGRREAWAESVARRLSEAEPSTPILLLDPAGYYAHPRTYLRGLQI